MALVRRLCFPQLWAAPSQAVHRSASLPGLPGNLGPRLACSNNIPHLTSSSLRCFAGEASLQHQTQTSRLEQLLKHSRITHLSHELWLQLVRPGDVVVDATCGNGHDAAFLANIVGSSASGGTVYAFDIQEAAIAATKATIEAAVPAENLPALHLVQGCHSKMQEVVGSNVARLICFNFGYLPGGDKSVTTSKETTLAAVEAAFEVLRPGGLLSMLCYTGHPGGKEEYEAVREAVADLPTAYWLTSEFQLLNRPTAPVLLLAWKQELGGP